MTKKKGENSISIQIKPVERPQPGVAGGGVKKFYASPVQGGEASLEELTKAIEKSSAVSGADIRAVLYAMVEEAVGGLSDGRIIRLGDLGSIRITLNSEGKATAEEVTAAAEQKSGRDLYAGQKIAGNVAQRQIYKGMIGTS